MLVGTLNTELEQEIVISTCRLITPSSFVAWAGEDVANAIAPPSSSADKDGFIVQDRSEGSGGQLYWSTQGSSTDKDTMFDVRTTAFFAWVAVIVLFLAIIL